MKNNIISGLLSIALSIAVPVVGMQMQQGANLANPNMAQVSAGLLVLFGGNNAVPVQRSFFSTSAAEFFSWCAVGISIAWQCKKYFDPAKNYIKNLIWQDRHHSASVHPVNPDAESKALSAEREAAERSVSFANIKRDTANAITANAIEDISREPIVRKDPTQETASEMARSLEDQIAQARIDVDKLQARASNALAQLRDPQEPERKRTMASAEVSDDPAMLALQRATKKLQQLAESSRAQLAYHRNAMNQLRAQVAYHRNAMNQLRAQAAEQQPVNTDLIADQCRASARDVHASQQRAHARLLNKEVRKCCNLLNQSDANISRARKLLNQLQGEPHE